MRNRLHLLVALALALGLLFAGCGGDDGDDKAAGSGSKTELTGTDFGAAELRANLTAGLQEHEYLAGIAVAQGVGSGLDSDEFTAAAGALDKNSIGLSKAIGSVYGKKAEKQFLKNWRDHIGYFVDYTKGKATKDEAAVRKARTDLDGYRATFGSFIAGANPKLEASTVADALKPHVQATEDAIDAVVAKSPEAFEKLRLAAAHMPELAKTLAVSIAQQFPDRFPGDADSMASTLRSNLTAGLQEHEYLAGIAVVNGLSAGLDSGEFKAAAGTLDKNSVALSDAIGSVYGDKAGDRFLKNWRDHIGYFVNYAKGRAKKDDAKVEMAKTDLDGYRATFGSFIAGANKSLSAKDVAAALKPHVQATEVAIDAVASGSGQAFDKLRIAAGHMPMLALTLSDAIATQFPDKFPSSGKGESSADAGHHAGMSHG